MPSVLLFDRSQQEIEYPGKPRNEKHGQNPGQLFAECGFSGKDNRHYGYEPNDKNDKCYKKQAISRIFHVFSLFQYMPMRHLFNHASECPGLRPVMDISYMFAMHIPSFFLAGINVLIYSGPSK